METVQTATPLYAIAVSLAAVVLIRISDKNPNLREFWTISAAIIKFAIVASMLPVIYSGKVIEYTLFTILPGLDIAFKVDALGIFFALTASFLWIITSFYSIGYVRALKERNQTRYFMFFALALSATMGVAFSANMFTTFIFYEIITLATFPLVAHKETAEAIKGARRYFIYLLGTSIAFQLTAIFLTYHAAGTLDFARQGILAGKGSDALLIIIFILFIAGIAKAAIMPFHSWLPAAMVAPTPVSALLHAVAVVKTGVFVVIRVLLHIFGIDLLQRLGLGTALAYAACFTIITASIIALRQDNLKLRLAYSTISQLSYIILGAALLTPSGIVGGVSHITMHAFAKITLFFCAGSLYISSHKTEISQLSGIGKKMPWTMTAFAIGTLSMIGVPSVGGFISKWNLVIGSLEAKNIMVLAVLLASTLLNTAYFAPIVFKAFFEKEHIEKGRHERHEDIKENPFMVVPLCLTAAATIILGLYPDFIISLAKEVIK